MPTASPRIWLFPLSVGQEGNIRFWTPLFSTRRIIRASIFSVRYIHTFLASPMYRPRFSATPWPAFFFVAPIKFVLVSRVMRMTIHKWNKKVDLYAVFIRRCKHMWVQIKKVLSRWAKFFVPQVNAIKNASLNLRTGDFLTIANTAKRLMRCLVDNL